MEEELHLIGFEEYSKISCRKKKSNNDHLFSNVQLAFSENKIRIDRYDRNEK
ncbi:MAG: hypothetical protein IPN55_02825 [Saprospiraceae bacterium]|nr:hypothetical protein [Candidatus Brachybacter algidus]